MKWLYHVCLVIVLSACAGLESVVRDGVKAGVEAADSNKDGVLTNKEVNDSKNDPNFWIAIGGALLGILGLGGAAGASRKASKIEAETDELYDKINAKP